MKILVAVASKHGSTYEIAQAIIEEIQEAGLTAELRDIEYYPLLQHYDAAIIGSAVYMGRWMSEAVKFLHDNQEELANIPVWLFSSGPLGDDLSAVDTEEEPYNIDELMAMSRAVGHQTFVGKLDESELGLAEKLIVKIVKVPKGDFRDWQAVSDWAQELVLALKPVPTII